MSNPSSELTVEQKVAVLEAALKDAQDNLRFAESKAGFIVVVMTATIALVPLIPSLKQSFNIEAIKKTFNDSSILNKDFTLNLEAFLVILPQILFIISLFLAIVSIIFAIKTLIPISDARQYANLKHDVSGKPCYPELFYPTGFDRDLSIFEALTKPNKNNKFKLTVKRQREIISKINSEQLVYTIGEQVIILGLIRDLKMLRVSYALRMIYFSIFFMILGLFITLIDKVF